MHGRRSLWGQTHEKAPRGIRTYLGRREFEIVEEGWTHGGNCVDFVAHGNGELAFIARTVRAVRTDDGDGFEDEHPDRKAFKRLATAYLVGHADKPISSV